MCLFALYLSSEVVLLLQSRYFFPQIKLMEWTENQKTNTVALTYYERHCNSEHITTDDIGTLLLPRNVTPAEATRHMVRHGVQVYPQILTASTANAVRQYILDRNQKEEGFFVIENKGRFSFGIDVNADPSIQQALSEIANHKSLVPALEQIVGPNPAIIEFTAITSVYGADEQRFHQDVVPAGSPFKYARNFMPSYSLFIPLQDISAEMGPTEVCPGTHVCQESAKDMCDKLGGLRLSNGDQPWKKGFGALVNQQLFHRGTGHLMKGGPERVLFILTFAPRPRFGKNQLETRMIGQSGSYSLRWNQWGHTLSDFGSAKKKMSEPFRTARALGLYAPTTESWGWDMATVASMRIANSDNGYSVEDLENFVENKGGLAWLPAFLKEPTKEEDGWTDWILRQTVKVNAFLCKAYIFMLVIYLALMVIAQIVVLFRPSVSRRHVLRRAILVLLITHGIIALAASLILYRVEHCQWAKNIKYGKAYVGVLSADTPALPGTIPFDLDVLKGDRYSSPYLASYNKMIDTTHPGNQLWSNMMSYHATGFSTLTTEVQLGLCANLVHVTKQFNFGRMLTQNEAGNWAEMSNRAAVRICHKELMQLDVTNDIIGRILVHLDYMISETRHGVWKDQAIHKVHVRDFLIKLQDKVMHLPLTKMTASHSDVVIKKSNVKVASTTIMVKFLASPPPTLKSRVVSPSRRVQFTQPVPDIEPDIKSAWIQEGDIVDAQYHGVFNEWYRAKVDVVSSNSGVVDVIYDDGEIDVGLCRLCVRPFVPYEVGEPVAAHDKEEGVFYAGRVVQVNAKSATYDIQTDDNGLMTVTAGSIRRAVSVLQKGARVEAKFQGVGEIWYPGTIIAEHDDGSFDVQYDDGDKEFEVEWEHIRIAYAL